jgi:iron complex outermembrane receptor protein
VNTLGGVIISEINDIHWSWNNWTWRAGAEFDIGPESMLYASVSTGFKAGGTSLVAGPAAVFDPEKLTAYEAGIKNRFFDNTLTLNLNAFYYDYTNYQASFVAPNPDFGGASVRRIANAGDAKIKGVELELNWMPTERDVFRGTVAYLHGKFGDYIVPTSNPLVFNDYSGSEMSVVPWAANASYSHDFSIGEDGHLVPQLSARYNSGAWRDARQYANSGVWGPPGTYANPIAFQDAFVKLDANLSYSWHEDKYRITAYVKNLTDHVVFTGATKGFLPGTDNAYLEPPRTFGASFYVAW